MTANEYQKMAARTINEDLINIGNEDLTKIGMEHHSLYGMCSEIGEIHSLYQKMYQGHGAPDKNHLKKEVGDLLWFIAEYCTSRDWNLEDVMRENIEKLYSRYPDGFEAEKSLHRREGDI